MRIFTLIMNETFKWAPKIIRQMATGSVWIYLSSHSNWVFHILQEVGAERKPIRPRHVYLKLGGYSWTKCVFHSKKISGGGHNLFLMNAWILINQQKTHKSNTPQSIPITPPTKFKFQIGGHPTGKYSAHHLEIFCQQSIMLNHMACSKLGGCTWSEYNLTSLIQQSFIWHPWYYDVFLWDQTS